MPLSLGTSPIKILQDVTPIRKEEAKSDNLLFDEVADEPNEFELLI